jgi:hypothetical protein
VILKRHRTTGTNTLNRETLNQLNRRFAAAVDDLVRWELFTLDGFRAALAHKLDGVIQLRPFHWADASLFGFTVGTVGADGRPHWLVLYEAEADAEHQLTIILHELMHIALGHVSATAQLTPEMFHTLLAAAGLVSDDAAVVTYTRACLNVDGLLTEREASEEREAELGAMWVLAQVRRAGALPPSGHPFAAEHRALDAHLRGEEEPHPC